MGFSGGGDSLALLKALTPLKAGRRSVHALIVDHGLRAESAGDAQRAAELAREAGAEPLILGWTGDKPATGVQARARRARHGLLAAAVRALGGADLFLAHTLDDQAETIWMRLKAGGGPRALCGMAETAASPVWPQGRGVALRRPLLKVRRDALRAWLENEGVRWIEDPSNEDHRFERVRARKRLGALEWAGFDPARLAALADDVAVIDRSGRIAAGRLLTRAVRLHAWGGADLDRQAFRRSEKAVAHTALEALVTAISGDPYPPKPAAIDGLLSALRAGQGATGGGVRLFQARGTDWLCRDAGAIAGRVDQIAEISRDRVGDFLVLDGRFAIENWPEGAVHGVLLGQRPDAVDLSHIPGEARGALMTLNEISGALLAVIGVTAPLNGALRITPLFAERTAMRLFPEGAPAWFDMGLETSMGATERPISAGSTR